MSSCGTRIVWRTIKPIKIGLVKVQSGTNMHYCCCHGFLDLISRHEGRLASASAPAIIACVGKEAKAPESSSPLKTLEFQILSSALGGRYCHLNLSRTHKKKAGNCLRLKQKLEAYSEWAVLWHFKGQDSSTVGGLADTSPSNSDWCRWLTGFSHCLINCCQWHFR